MAFWSKWFQRQPKISFKQVDWLEVDGKRRAIEALRASQQQGDAKQAVIQADILVDSILKQAQVPGMTMGERLKAIREPMPRDVYRSLWQAHLKRNELVHESNSFVAEWEKKEYLHAFEEAIRFFRGQR